MSEKIFAHIVSEQFVNFVCNLYQDCPKRGIWCGLPDVSSEKNNKKIIWKDYNMNHCFFCFILGKKKVFRYVESLIIEVEGIYGSPERQVKEKKIRTT